MESKFDAIISGPSWRHGDDDSRRAILVAARAVAKVARAVVAKFPWPTVLRGAQTARSAAIRDVPANGLTITSPGRYALASDVHWRAPSPNCAAVTVLSSNVVLDLGGHTLLVDALQRGVVAIAVGDGRVPLHNVTVGNGVVAGGTLYGVAAALVDGLVLSGLHAEGLTPADAAAVPAAVFIAACDGANITGCTAERVHGVANSLNAFHVRLSAGVTFEDCSVSGVHNDAGGCVGFGASACDELHYRRCVAEQLSTGNLLPPGSMGHTCIGFLPFLCTQTRVVHCAARHVAGSCDDAHGISVFVCPARVLVADCVFEDVSTGFGVTGTGAKSTGAEVMVSSDVHVARCTARRIAARRPQDGQCAGFSTGMTAGVSFTDCAASDVRCVGMGTGSKNGPGGVGFGWAPDPRAMFIGPSEHTAYTRCTAEACDVGFDLFNHVAPQLKSCSARHVRVKEVSGPPFEERVLTCDVCSECPKKTSTVVVSK